MKRERVEEYRVWLSYVEKKEVLQKSKGRCAHCGKKITVGKDGTFSLDHVIPLSKGGSNDVSNLVGLCDACNKEKGDRIVDIDTWYKFVKPDCGKTLKESFEKYCQDFEFLSKKSIFSTDVFPIEVAMYPTVNRRAYGKYIKSTKTVNVQKAMYSDLDDIYNMMLEYLHFYLDNDDPAVQSTLNEIVEDEELDDYTSEDEIKADLKNQLSNWYLQGAIYFSRSTSGKVNMVIPAKIESHVDEFPDSNPDDFTFKFFYKAGPIYISPKVTLKNVQSYSYFTSLISCFINTIGTCVYFPAVMEVIVLLQNARVDDRIRTILESIFCGNAQRKKETFKQDVDRGFLPLIMTNPRATEELMKSGSRNAIVGEIRLINSRSMYESDPVFKSIVDDTSKYLEKCLEVSKEQTSVVK